MAARIASPSTSSWSAWILAARPATLPAAVVPVIVGTAAAGSGLARPLAFLAALVAAVLIQVGTNFANDLFDFQKGADTAARLGPPRVTQTGLIAPSRVAVAVYLTFGLAALIGLYLVSIGGWPIAVVGVLSILAGLAYTGGPWPLGYHGLGDLFVFLFFGIVAVVGSAYLQTNLVTPLALAAAVPIGFLVTAILVVNNLRDVDTDRLAGKHTLAVRIGRRATRIQYAALVLGAYAIPVGLRLAGAMGPWFWLPWLSLPLAISLVRDVTQDSDALVLNRTLNHALKRTGHLLLIFGLLFTAGLVL